MKERYETHAEWLAEGERLFGKDVKAWRFVCPICGHVATPKDWHDAGDTDHSMMAFSCIGRLLPSCRKAFGEKGPGPCDYAGGGLFRMNPVEIVDRNTRVFQFAPLTPPADAGEGVQP